MVKYIFGSCIGFVPVGAGGIPVHVEAAEVDSLQVGVVLGTDGSELPQLLS